MACSVFKMRVKLCVDPHKRIGSRLPFKRATKNKDRTRKQMQRMKQEIKDLKETIVEKNQKAKKRIEHTNFYLGKVKHLEKTIALEQSVTKFRIEGYQDRVARDWDKIQTLQRTKHKLLRMRNAAVIEHRWDCRLIDHLHETLGVLRAVLLAEGFAVDVVKGLNGALAQ